VVTPAVWALGERRLDWLAITHADRDHVGGAASVAAALRPREIWEGAPVPPNEDRRTLADTARRRTQVWRQIHAGHALTLGDVDMEVLHPPIPDWERQRVRNDDSIVFRIRYGLVELLLTGDIGEGIERTLAVADGPPIRILRVAHHGSRTSSSAGFVRAYGAQVALVSAGRGNLFGHPAADVVARLTRDGARLFRTDRDGAISVETDGRVVMLTTMSGKAWEVRASHWPS
jgi:competence protein ComEC